MNWKGVEGVEVVNGKPSYKGTLIPIYLSGDALKRFAQQIDEKQNRATTLAEGNKLADQQTKLATEFRSKLPEYTGLLQDQSKKTIQRNLAENISNLKQKSSNAGFLGGSGTQKQQAEAIAGSQAETMQKDFDIADTLESQAKQFENTALATKMSLQGSANQAQIDALRQNILDSQRQSELWRALGSAAGTGIGAYYGAKS